MQGKIFTNWHTGNIVLIRDSLSNETEKFLTVFHNFEEQ